MLRIAEKLLGLQELLHCM